MDPVVLGVAAMDRKARSKPMQNILNRMLANRDLNIHIVNFGDKVLIDEPPESWPVVDVLISFFSSGFPLEKAIAYVDLRKPVCVNDVRFQKVLWDRRAVLAILDAIGVPTPRRIEVDRDGGPQVDTAVSADVRRRLGIDLMSPRVAKRCELFNDDLLLVDNRERMAKPFVEKPVSGEDHNIHIYFPRSRGGGGRKLFRKVGNKSSEFDPNLTEPREKGSFIYEEFMDVDNAEDVKVYTIGPYFVHAETRKSPVVDGLVKRNPDGKEIRYITKLTDDEVLMATSISKAFKQNICGFDLLRVGSKSYVIDVNGWSFVKGNDFYYDKCAEILSKFCMTSVPRRALSSQGISSNDHEQANWMLKANVTVFRHGDRTPKQKLKRTFKPKDEWATPLIALLQGRREEIILRQSLELVSNAAEEASALPGAKIDDLKTIVHLIDVKKDLPGTKVQMKPTFDNETDQLQKMQLIIKWGGEFSHAARHQAKDYGQSMRKDLRLLNEGMLRNTRIYTSSERRVTASAEIFATAFLADLDNRSTQDESLELMIRKDLLDDSNAAKDLMDDVKKHLKASLRPSSPNAQTHPEDWPDDLPPPSELCHRIAELLKSLKETMTINFKTLNVNNIQPRWCTRETPSLFQERWEKLFSDFEYDPYDPSRCSELFDMLSHDGLHNRSFLETIFSSNSDPPEQRLDRLHMLYRYSLALFTYICPREYGMTPEEKERIGLLTSMPLLNNIIGDLKSARDEGPLCALYFTKESHIHTLLNLILASNFPLVMQRMPPLDYFSSITFEVFEKVSTSNAGASSSNSSHSPTPSFTQGVDTASNGGGSISSNHRPERSLLISVSEGAHSSEILYINLDARHALTPLPRRPLTPHMPLDEALAKLEVHATRQRDIGDTRRGLVEGAEVFFGEIEGEQGVLPVKHRRESLDTDHSSVRQG